MLSDEEARSHGTWGGLREHRRLGAGVLADLLGWGYFVDEGVLLLKDGGLMCSWRYEGPDVISSSLEERRLLARHINDALLPFGGDWGFYFDALRRPAATNPAEGAFPDPVTRLIDEERRGALQKERSYFASECYFTLIQAPPVESAERLGAFFMQGSARRGIDWSARLTAFLASSSQLAERLEGHFMLSSLSSDELTRYLSYCLNGEWQNVGAPIPSLEVAAALACKTFFGGMRPRVGKRQVRVVAIHGFPEATDAGALDALSLLGGTYRWTTRFIPLDSQSAARELRRQQLMWFQKRRGLSSWLIDIIGRRHRNAYQMKQEEQFWDKDAARNAEEIAGAIASNSGAEARFGYFTATITVMDVDEEAADSLASEAMKALTDRGFTARLEDINAVEAFLGSLPGHGYYNVRRPILSSLNLVHLVPTTSIWSGAEHNPSPYFPAGSPPLLVTKTDGSTPFRLHLHEGDVGHTLVIGRTGAGKSVLVGTLAAQWLRYAESQVFLFDVGYSSYLLARACGAMHYDLAAGRPDVIPLQPLSSVDDAAERAWSASWLEGLMELQGLSVRPAHRRVLSHALGLVADSSRAHRTLTELWAQLRSEELRDALLPYTAAGDYGALLDGDTDGIRSTVHSPIHFSGEERSESNYGLAAERFQVFEMRHLIELSDKVLIPVLLYLFRCVEERLSSGRPTLIIIEEAWAALMRGVFAERLRKWLMTLRKQNAAVLLVAHSPSQFEEAGMPLLIEQCPTRIFLPNPDALQSTAAYEQLGLNREEIEALSQSQAKRDYLFKSPTGARVFDLEIGEVLRAFLTAMPDTSMNETIRRAQMLMDQEVNWPATWLRERGAEAWAERIGEFSHKMSVPT